MTEHLRHIEVERLHTVGLTEREMSIARCLAHHIQRSTLAFGNAANVVDMFFIDEQSHTLLALVGNDFLCRERLVANGQLRHVNLSTTLFHQLGQAVQVACRTVVVDRHYGVHVFFAQRTHEVVGAFLHLGVGTLHGVQLDAVAVAARVH